MSPFELLSVGVNLIGLSLIYLQIKADHARRKSQATIEYIQSIRPLWETHRKWIEKRYGLDPLPETIVEDMKRNKQIWENVRGLLAILEHLSIGANTDVFNKKLIYRMSGTYFIKIYNRLFPYIQYSQKTNKFAYIEYEELVKDFKQKKKNNSDPRRGWLINKYFF